MVFSVKYKKKKTEENIVPDYRLIETQADLEAYAAKIAKEKIVGVDLEADSMHHYEEKVCLIQMATKKTAAIIDTLAVRNLSPLEPMFANPRVRKIFHGSDYDIRSLYRDFEIEIHNLFDTQVATRFLGYRATGLDAVVKERFDIILDKKYQRKNWSKRPLPKEMLDYAIRDAIYLIPLTKMLEKELKKKRRLAWVREECEILSGVRPQPMNNGPLFANFKGAGLLRRRNLAVLESLLQLRKSIAKKKDRPFFKVFGNQPLLVLARECPENLPQLEKSKALSKKQVRIHGKQVVKAVKTGLAVPEKDLPVYPRKRSPKPSPETPERVKAVKNWRDQKAKILEIDPGIIFTKAQLAAIAEKNPAKSKELKALGELREWQKKAFGKEVLAVLKKCRTLGF